MMKTSTKLHLAAVVAGLSCLSGCSLLVRAAKGELTPVGADQASSSDVNSRMGTLTRSTDPAAFKQAFTELTSIYMYKCMEAPNMVPKEGRSEIREAAGAGLVSAMQRRVAEFGAEDPTVDAAAADLAALEGRMSKCDADKRSKQDGAGHFGTALAMTQSEGRQTYMNDKAAAVDGDLEAAIGQGDNAVDKWVRNTCGAVLPEWGYCAPRAVEVLHGKGNLASLVNVFVGGRGEEGEKMLPGLGAKVGQAELVAELRDYMMSGKAPTEVRASGLEGIAKFLQANDAWGSCADRSGLMRSALSTGEARVGGWAIEHLVEEGCHTLDADLVTALGSDSPYIREKAAWASGELGIKKAKKHLERLRWSDPYLDEGCWCRPVRDAASNAFNKLEIAEG